MSVHDKLIYVDNTFPDESHLFDSFEKCEIYPMVQLQLSFYKCRGGRGWLSIACNVNVFMGFKCVMLQVPHSWQKLMC
jgi:hypothetical protein